MDRSSYQGGWRRGIAIDPFDQSRPLPDLQTLSWEQGPRFNPRRLVVKQDELVFSRNFSGVIDEENTEFSHFRLASDLIPHRAVG